jgi:hypothetical protein
MVGPSPSDFRFSTRIECRKCGQSGSATWDEIDGELIQVEQSDEFSQRVGRENRPLFPETVCGGCGALQYRPVPTDPPVKP